MDKLTLLAQTKLYSTVGEPGHRWILVEIPIKMPDGSILYVKGWHLEHHVLSIPHG